MRFRAPGALPRAGAVAVVAACAVLGCAAAPAVAGTAERGLVTLIDNSEADSIIEIDRTADLLIGRGAAGSDHDGSTTLVGGLLGTAPAPPESEEGNEE
ncbi:hypothetical protein GCM10009639_60860 [Kitasatospora putterlickiae]|uniref:Uncharacterized protein n=1 Tax=Kitasatospora putterlickiae TaxID=221725 RepID=A0ABN1YFI5_9ACTN